MTPQVKLSRGFFERKVARATEDNRDAAYANLRANPKNRMTTSRTRTTREAVWVFSASLVFALAFTYPILEHLREYGAAGDWDLITSLTWVPFYSLTHFHQFPQWDAYRCGGLPMIGNPQSRIVTPFFLIDLAFGPVIGTHLEVILHIAVAFSGAYVAARLLGLRPLASMVAGAAFGSTSWFYLHAAAGHETFLAAAYMPWIAALFWVSLERKSWSAAIAAGMLVALTFLDGAVYTIVWAGIMVACLAIGFARVKLRLRPLLTGAVIGLSSLGFVAIKLLPALEMVRRYPRDSMGPETNWLSVLPVFLFSRYQPMAPRPEISGFGFWEYGAYISLPFAALAVVGLVASRRRALPWAIVGVVFLIFYMGDTGPDALWTLMRAHAGLGAMRLPARCLIGLVLSVAMLAAMGADAISSGFGTWGSRAVAILLAIGVCDAWLVGPPSLVHIFDTTDAPQPMSLEFKQTSQPMARFHMMLNLQSNIGVIPCYDFALIPTSVTGFEDKNYRGEQYLAGGNVALVRWTPNALSYNIDASTPGELVVNRNYDASWRLAAGNGEVVSHGGLLAVKVPSGRQHLELAYRNFRLMLGLGIAVASFLAMIAVSYFEKRTQSSS
jgi:hypothetical protein